MEKITTFKKTLLRIGYTYDELNNKVFVNDNDFANACLDYVLETINLIDDEKIHYRGIESFVEEGTNYYMFATVMTIDDDKNVWRYDFTYNKESKVVSLSSTRLM